MSRQERRARKRLLRWRRIKRLARQGDTLPLPDVRWLVRRVTQLEREVAWAETKIDDLYYASEFQE